MVHQAGLQTNPQMTCPKVTEQVPHSPVLKWFDLPKCGSNERNPVNLESLRKAGIVCCHLLSADFPCVTSARSLAAGAFRQGWSSCRGPVCATLYPKCWCCLWRVRNFSLAPLLLHPSWGVRQAAAISFHSFPSDFIHQGGFTKPDPSFPPPRFIFLRDLIKGNLSSHFSINGCI